MAVHGFWDMTLKQEFQNLISSNNSLYIYGCGNFGKKIFSMIEFFGMKSKVKAFLVTDACLAGAFYLDVPVVRVDDFSDSEGLILISLTEIYHADVESKLKSLKIENYINAFKYCFIDIDRDECVQYVSVRELLKKLFYKNEYGNLDVLIRLLAIEDLYGKNNCGVKLYKAWMDSCLGRYKTDMAPSEIYFSRFVSLIDSVKKNGFYKDSEIVVSKDGNVANGKHRLTLAIFHSVEKIKVRQVFSWQPFIATEDLYRKTFSETELALIMNRLNQVKEKYGI